MWWERARSAVSSGLMRTGAVFRKIGDVGAPVIRKIGSVSGALRPAVSAVGAALAPLTDGASLGVAGLVNKGLGAVSKAAGHADSIAQRIGNFGSQLQGYGAAMK